MDLSARALTFQTLRQRGKTRFRAIPVPDTLLDALDLVHQVRKAQRMKSGGKDCPLWPWGRTQATKHIWMVMAQADIVGPHATPKGLRHGFGVKAAADTRNPSLVQKWLGHQNLETTVIYMGAYDAKHLICIFLAGSTVGIWLEASAKRRSECNPAP